MLLFLCLRRSCVWCLACTTMYVYVRLFRKKNDLKFWPLMICDKFFFMSKNEQNKQSKLNFLVKTFVSYHFTTYQMYNNSIRFSTQTFLPTKKYLYQYHIRVYQKVLNYLGIIYMMSSEFFSFYTCWVEFWKKYNFATEWIWCIVLVLKFP